MSEKWANGSQAWCDLCPSAPCYVLCGASHCPHPYIYKIHPPEPHSAKLLIGTPTKHCQSKIGFYGGYLLKNQRNVKQSVVKKGVPLKSDFFSLVVFEHVLETEYFSEKGSYALGLSHPGSKGFSTKTPTFCEIL